MFGFQITALDKILKWFLVPIALLVQIAIRQMDLVLKAFQDQLSFFFEGWYFSLILLINIFFVQKILLGSMQLWRKFLGSFELRRLFGWFLWNQLYKLVFNLRPSRRLVRRRSWRCWLRLRDRIHWSHRKNFILILILTFDFVFFERKPILTSSFFRSFLFFLKK